MNKTINLLFFALTFVSCQQIKEKKSDGAIEIVSFANVSYRDFKVELDSLSSYKIINIYPIIWDGKAALIYSNKADNSLRIIDKQEGKQIHKINLPKPENNGLSELFGFIYVNQDSIFVMGNFGEKFQLYNYKGELLKNYRLTNQYEDTFFGFGRRSSANLNPMFIREDKIYLKGFPMYNISNPKIFFQKIPQMISIDLNSETYDYLSIKYPRKYADGYYNFNNGFTFNKVEDVLVFNFASDDYLNIYSFPEFSLTTVAAPSNFFSNIPPLSEPGQEDIYEISNPFYYGVIYDSFRNCYYRINYLGQEYLDPNGSPNTYSSSPFSITILNSKFNKLKEVKFPKNTYDFSCIFVDREGLYISTSNENNPDFSEDMVIFHVFNFE